MLSPYEALDILLDQAAFDDWVRDSGLSVREARRQLNQATTTLMTRDAPPLEAAWVRQARRANARRTHATGRRADVDQLCDFVDRAARLPPRVKEVFQCCIVNGMTRRECAERLGITTATVRVHLRRLRRLMRRCGGVSGENYPLGQSVPRG